MPTKPGRDSDLHTLHIRCGSDIEHKLRLAGFQGDFLEFADPFCIGPVPDLPQEEFIRTRAAFIASAFDMPEANALARLQREYGVLDRLADYQRIVLWFEHDSYDQLILAYLCWRLAQVTPPGRLELVVVDDFPGVKRFIGLGQLEPESLTQLWEQRRPLSDALLQQGSAAWTAVTASTPEPLESLSRNGTPALPMMARALQRHLRELPSTRDGLGLTERLTLEAVRDLGPIPVGRTFAELLNAREPLPYLGDLMFWWLIQPLLGIALEVMGDADTAWSDKVLVLTATGAAVLDGHDDWLRHAPRERWVGGVAVLAGGAACWRYDETRERVVFV